MNTRQKLLQRIDELNLERCEKCSTYNLTTSDIYCECPAAVEIRSLGARLLGSRKRSIPEDGNDHLIEQFAKEMTVDVYRQLREKNYSIMRIATEAKISKTRLNKWRKENNFVHNEPEVKRDEIKRSDHDPIYKQYMQLAKKNGIPHMTYYHRVKISGWDPKRAATEKVHKQQRN